MVTMTPAQRAIYDRLLAAAKAIGPCAEDPKKTSIHLTCRTAFAGVATRKDALLVTMKLPADVRSARVVKRLHASRGRWYVDVKLEDPKDVDREMKAWLKSAMAISS